MVRTNAVLNVGSIIVLLRGFLTCQKMILQVISSKSSQSFPLVSYFCEII